MKDDSKMFYVEIGLFASKHTQYQIQGELHVRSIQKQTNLQSVINERGDLVAKLNRHIITGHNISLELTLILILGIMDHIHCRPTPNLQFKDSVDHINFLVRNSIG